MATRAKTWTALWPAALAMIVLMLLTTGWFWAKGQAEKKFAQQATKHESRTALTCSNATWSGYPFKLQLDCAKPIIHLNQGQTQLRPQKLIGHILVTSPRTIHIKLHGPTLVHDINTATTTTLQHQPTTSSLHFQSTSSISSDTEISAVAVEQSETTIAAIDKIRLQTTNGIGSESEITVKLELSNLRVQELTPDPVVISEMEAAILARNVPLRPTANAVDWMKAAAKQNTMFEVEDFQARYGATRLTAKGPFKIARNGTIDGSLKTHVIDLDAFLHELQQRQVMTPKNAQAASALLGIFDKGEGIEAELRFQDEQMYWGPLNLGEQTPLF